MKIAVFPLFAFDFCDFGAQKDRFKKDFLDRASGLLMKIAVVLLFAFDFCDSGENQRFPLFAFKICDFGAHKTRFSRFP